jgi:hypothetical protein
LGGVEHDYGYITPMLSKGLLVAVSGFAAASSLYAATIGTDANPYLSITERNTFGLKPPVSIGPPEPPKPAASKIVLQGVTTILGRRQVLFKINVPARAPEPARESNYMLSEGQRDGEIEVIEVNEKTGIVKFNNAGMIEVLSMDKDAAKPTAGPASPPPNSPPGALPSALPGIPPPSPTTLPGVSATTGNTPAAAFGATDQRTIPSRTLRTSATPNPQNMNGISGFGGNPQIANQLGNPGQNYPALSREEQAALMLLNKEKLKQQGREDVANLIPNPIQETK